MALAASPRRPSSRQHDFARAPAPSIRRSTFSRDTSLKTTIDAGKLYPFLVDELLPGDTVQLSPQILARLNPMVVPPLDNLYLDLHAFFVPNRLVWDNWVRMMGEQDDPDSSIDYTIPFLRESSPGAPIVIAPDSLGDYMGLPVDVPLPYSGFDDDELMYVNALPFRAYNLIWNQWFRDQNYQDSVLVPKDDGPDLLSAYNLMYRGKRHDYFTSALPSPQKGPQVTLSLLGEAPVISDPNTDGVPDFLFHPTAGGSDSSAGALLVDAASSNVETVSVSGTQSFLKWDTTALSTNLNGVSVLTVNELRTAVSVQQLLELYARSGTRYVELLRAEFGVEPEDFRLQRPEFLGGSSNLVSMEVVPQTSAPTEDSPQAALASNGLVSGSLNIQYNVKEHGYLFVIASVRADLTYQQGLRKMWSRRTRYDFFHPAFENLGEQAVLKREFMALDPTSYPSYNGQVWGYQERYAEYRYFPSLVTGKMRSVAPQTLDNWHYALSYDTPVSLDDGFITDVPQLRALAYTSEPAFLVDGYFRYKHTRPMAVYNIPGLRRV